MFGKLLKYEFKATARVFLPLYGLMMLTGLCGVFLGMINSISPMPGWITGLTVSFYVLMLMALITATGVIIIWRFYKNLLSREGYLMFTLPVKTSSLLWSKVLTAVTWTVLSGFTAFLAGVMVANSNYSLSEIADFFAQFSKGIPLALAQKGATLAVIQIVIFMVAALFQFPLQCYTALSLGQLSNKYRLGVAFGAYIAMNIAMQIVSTVITVVFSATIKNELYSFVPSVIFVVFSVVGFFIITNYLLSKKLNLA